MYLQTGDQTSQAPPLELLDLDVDAGAPGAEGSVPEVAHLRLWPWFAVGLVAIAAVAVVAQAGVGGASQPAKPMTPAWESGRTVAATPAVPDGLEGFAELYVSAYLTATGPERQTIIQRYYPAAPELNERRTFDRYVTRSVVVDIEHAGVESWQLTVAAEVLAYDGRTYVLDGTHHYAVAISTPYERPFVATTLPMRVAAPPTGEILAVVSGVPLTDPGLRSLAAGFVRVYTVGGEDLARYTTAGFQPASMSPPPFTRVTIDDLTAVQISPERLQVRVAGIGTPGTGSPLAIEYHLTVVTEAGAWKVAGLAPGPLTATQLAAHRPPATHGN